MTPPCSPVFPAAVIARLDSTETHRPFDADEEDRQNDEDDEQEELERQERQDEEDGEDIYSDDLQPRPNCRVQAANFWVAFMQEPCHDVMCGLVAR